MPDEAPRPEVMFAVVVVLAFAVVRLVRWIQQAAPQPDPWDKEIEEAVQAEDAVSLCPHCLAPQESETWFCAECGCSIGPYNNLNPYLYLFSVGDLFRAGVSGRVRRSPLVVAGFVVFSLLEYTLFAPFYWFLFFRNLRRQRAESGETNPPVPAA